MTGSSVTLQETDGPGNREKTRRRFDHESHEWEGVVVADWRAPLPVKHLVLYTEISRSALAHGSPAMTVC